MCAHAREGGAEVKAEEKAVEGVAASRLVRCSSILRLIVASIKRLFNRGSGTTPSSEPQQSPEESASTQTRRNLLPDSVELAPPEFRWLWEMKAREQPCSDPSQNRPL